MTSFRFFAATAALFCVFSAALSGQQVKIADVTILPPTAGLKPILTNGQMMVGAREVYNSPLNGSMVAALKAAKTRAEQEDAVLRFISSELRKKFEEAKAEGQSVTDPKEIKPATDEKEALNLAENKQPFTTFSEWGSSPFGKPATSWKDLRDHFSEYMDSVIERTKYPDEMKADWIDSLHDCLQKGPDGVYCKEVNVQDWPLWQWTTGRTAGTVKNGQAPGVNIKYTGKFAKALWIALPKYGMAVMHGYECRGNPIVPFVGTTTFRLTKDEVEPHEPAVPQKCNCEIIQISGSVGRKGVAEIYPDQTVEMEAVVTGSLDKLRFQKESWLVDGNLKLGNQRRFVFRPKDYDFIPGTYKVEFKLVDQFGQTTICEFAVVIKSRPEVTVTKPIPPKPEPRTVKKSGRGKWVALAAVIGGGALCGVYCRGGGGRAVVPNQPPSGVKVGVSAPGTP